MSRPKIFSRLSRRLRGSEKDEQHDIPATKHAPKPPTKSTIFRVTGLPIGPEDEIIPSLKEAIHQRVSSSELEQLGKITVAASCRNDKISVALLEWKGDTPSFLSSLDKNQL
jgi:hypothetical protein